MESKIKKPPMDLEELDAQQGEQQDEGTKGSQKLSKEKPQKRSLGYLGNKGGGGGGGKFSRFGGEGTFSQKNLILVGLAVLISFTISIFIFTRQSDSKVLLDNQQILQSSLNTQKGRIDNVISNYATTESLSTYAKKTDLPNMSGYVTTSQMDTAIANIPTNNSTCFGYLTESSGIYTLHVDASPGTYIAKVYLVYSTPYSLNVTTLEGSYVSFGGNWTGRNFIPEFVLNGTGYEVIGASFYTGTFEVTGDSYSIALSSFSAPGTYVVSVEIMSAIKPSGGGGSI